MSFILSLLLSKYGIIGIVSSIVAIFLYSKGRSDANSANREHEQEVQEALMDDVRKAEKINQTLDKERDKNVQNANSTSTIADIIKLLNKTFSGKDKDSDA